MKVYRYENRFDGGGPFFYRNGISRFDSEISFSDTRLSACESISSLIKYFANQGFTQDMLKDYQIIEYDIPDSKIILTRFHIYFEPKDIISFQPVSTIPDECKGVE